MGKDVTVCIRGVQSVAGSPENEAGDSIELVVPGTYSVRDGLEIVEYDEIFEGFESMPTRNRVEIREGSLEVHKAGAVNVDMAFMPGKRHQAHYAVPFGVIEMEIVTESVDIRRKEDEIRIRTEYALAMGGEAAADCILDMRVELGL
ncbi:MAG: DUF1934 domain-containing protein [Lachnospiraceae bacterium]|nr:DUF1934 domain-containing protein [Lachnospiraceae bacterium]